jgi:hypothetical protein
MPRDATKTRHHGQHSASQGEVVGGCNFCHSSFGP